MSLRVRLVHTAALSIALLGTSCGSGAIEDLFPDVMTVVATGLTGTVTLTVDATNDGTYEITADGTYQLSHSFPVNDTYTLSASSAAGQTCTLSPSGGTFSDDTTVTLTCGAPITVSGIANGLRSGSSVNVTLNGNTATTLTASGAFQFTVASGTDVTVAASGVGYHCTTTNGTATDLAATKSDVLIGCKQEQMFYSGGISGGNMGGRSGANATCAAVSGADNCGGTAAFLSVAADDEVRDFPTTYLIRTDRPLYYGTTKIADDWSDLLDGSVDNGIPIEFWSGSDESGALHSNNCLGWTDTSVNVRTGRSGLDDRTDSNWISFNDNYCYFDRDISILCLCMQDDYQLSGTITGTGGGTAVLTLNGLETVSVNADATFYFGTSFAVGATYSVVVTTQPDDRLCTVTGGSGSMSSSSAITVTCVDDDDIDSDGLLDATEANFAFAPYVSPQGTIGMTSSNVTDYRGSSTSFRTPTGITISAVGLSSSTANTDLDGDDVSDSAEITAGSNLFVAASTGTLATSSTVTLAASTLMMDSIVADFSGDGVLDLASVGIGASSVGVVAIGNGSGGFGTASSFTVGSEPAALAAADFDEDGDMDLVIANSATDNVSVILNNGTGSLSSLTNYSVGDYPYDIAVGDWNGDGHIDIAVANRGPSTDNTTLSILLGDGDGALGTATSVTTNAGPSFLTTGDFDNDGDLDLAVTHRGFNGTGTTFSVFTNNGSGTFGGKTDYTTEAAPGGITTGDFDSDGDLDLAIANTGAMDDGNTLSVFLNASGVFGTRTNYSIGTGPVGIVTLDVDGDGDLDLLAANTAATSGSTLALLKGDDTGAFAAATAVSVGSAPLQMAPGDFDRDGDLDVLVTNFASGNASVVGNQ